MRTFTRRRVFAGLASAITAPIGACCLVNPIPGGFPPGNPSSPLTIDVHAHFFNGADLQVNAFFQHIFLPDNPELAPLGPVLQEFAWDIAPSAKEELVALEEVAATTGIFSRETFDQVYGRHSQAAYTKGLAALRDAVARAKVRMQQQDKQLVEAKINLFPEQYSDYLKHPFVTTGFTIADALAFIVRNLQYRYVNLVDYLSTYSSGNERSIDLIVAHLVDLDWPIANGKETLSSISDQILVMEKIMALSGGRVHCFVPFDPMKEVAYCLGASPTSSLATVKQAIDANTGFIGVKLYPPMGFAPYGNAQIPAGSWDVPWIPPILRGLPDFGARMDQALLELYTFCRSNDVPIMAHTARSNAPSKTFYDKFLDPSAWTRVPAGLRVNFGHFGDTDIGEPTGDAGRPLLFANLMSAGSGTQGEFFFADTAYLADGLSHPDALEASLAVLYRATSGKGSAALAQRLMFGTDWEMIIIEGHKPDQYLTQFEAIFHHLDGADGIGAQGLLSDRFFGINAANFLGLRRGSTPNSRSRLQTFYDTHAVPRPLWVTKVDSLVV